MVAANLCLLSTRAASSSADTPEASSLALARRIWHHHVAAARIEVAGDDDHAIRIIAAALDRDHVLYPPRRPRACACR